MIGPDSSVAHYRVESLLGMGGMGEVYKAVDTRLGRPVALKVLPADLNQNRDRIRRFLQEAKAASSLNHPNILTVYDAGEMQIDGSAVHFIASELIEGKTLRELIHRERLPLQRILEFLAQAADGISKAHAAGIVHRDLKPDNIMVTADGYAKVLDFGLAKLVESSGESASLDPTKTREGIVMGTVAYMSPEQARAESVDHRSDIFSFASIVYEAAARKPPFTGVSEPDILHRIAHYEPEPLTDAPEGLVRLLTRALAKDPGERTQSMKDVALELRDIKRGLESGRVPAVRRASRGWIAIALFTLLAGAAAGFFLRPRASQGRPIRFSVSAPEQTFLAGTPNSATALQFALSPDGRRLIFVAAAAGEKPRLWLRELASVEARPLAGTEGAFFPFWSPDGNAVAFFAGDELRRVSTLGGPPTVVAVNVIDPRGGSWSRDDVILFAGVVGASPLYRVPAAGGEAVAATAAEQAAQNPPRWPYFLPDGKRFLFLGQGSSHSKRAIYAGTLGSKDVQRISESDSNAQFVAPDRLFFMRKGSLVSQRVDPATLRPVGDAVLVERRVGYAPVIRYGAFSVSQNDMIAFAPWTNPNRRLTWVDRQGRIVGTASEPADWGTTSLSLRAGKAALTRIDPGTGNLDVWSVDVARGVGSPIITRETDDNLPIWSPDASAIAFVSSSGAESDIHLHNLNDGTGRTLSRNIAGRITDWTPDGRYIVHNRRGSESGGDIWLIPTREGEAERKFMATPQYESDGRVSPDGRWIAYVSTDTGAQDVYLQPFPAGGERYRVTTEGGTLPTWGPDGKELYFVTPDNEVGSVRIAQRGNRIESTRAVPLFRIPGVIPPPNAFRTAFEIAPDGRFLFMLSPPEGVRSTITVAVHWGEK